MRLIDADKINFNQDDTEVVFEVLHAEPIEAIPISWIKHFKEEMKNHIQDSVNQHTYMYDHLIDEWERR